jgi:hypothetical protein
LWGASRDLRRPRDEVEPIHSAGPSLLRSPTGGSATYGTSAAIPVKAVP